MPHTPERASLEAQDWFGSERSQEILARAQRVIPGGVNSPVRAFRSVGGNPLFIAAGEGPLLIDIDGNRYIDYICSWGPLIFGHNSEIVRSALEEILHLGTSFGAPTEREVIFAEILCDLLPGIEMVRMVSSGTEAMMSIARLARGYTGRELIVKCDGCYHGHADSFLVKSGSGAATLGISGSAGVPREVAAHTISVSFNDIEVLEEAIRLHGAERIAAIVLEPVPGNMGLVLPQPGYLRAVRDLCDSHGILLVFDEVMSGFRVDLRGASGRFGVTPDLAAYGKVIGGGLPAAAFGGSREVMSSLAPLGSVYQAGTLSGNPLAVAAGIAVLSNLQASDPYAELELLAEQLMQGFKDAANSEGIPLQVSYCGSMFGFFFSENPVVNFADAQAANQVMFRHFFHEMLSRGVYLAPSAFEAGFLSTMHLATHIEQSIVAAQESFAVLAKLEL